MLFDPRPKEKRSELFDREDELKELRSLVEEGPPVILLVGIRRIGKTSVLKTFLNESSSPHIFIDARKLSEFEFSRAGLYAVLSEEFSRLGRKFSGILKYLKIRGVRISGFEVEFDWKKERPSIFMLLDRVNEFGAQSGETFLVAIDEAQLLRFMRGRGKVDFRQVIAYCYDNLKNVKFLLSGSEVGLLHSFIGIEDPSSPMYGRIYGEVVVDRFDREKSLTFLKKGFLELGIEVPEDLVERAVNTLDGIPGWLAHFGYAYAKLRRGNALDRILNEAIELALSEVRKLGNLSELYVHVLKAVAMGYDRWNSIKKAAEAWMGRPVPGQTLARILKNLEKMSILKSGERYEFHDPVVREASKRL